MISVNRIGPLSGLLALVALSFATFAEDSPNQGWQLQMLLAPTPQQIALEQQKSRVFIYSRVKEPDLDRAMDEQFGRVEHMMFINTLVPEPESKAEAMQPAGKTTWGEQDDGC